MVSEQFLTDTADYADIVLPATTQLEHDDIMFSWGHLYVTLQPPAIEPLGEAVPNTELFRRLAARMGFDDPVFRRTDEEMIAEAFDWSHPHMEGITVDSLKAQGWAAAQPPAADDYAPHAEGNFPTPSGKTEFVVLGGGGRATSSCRCSARAPTTTSPAAAGRPAAALHPAARVRARRPRAGRALPAQPADAEVARLHQLQLRRITTTSARSRSEPSVVIHPDDAAARGIADGVPVRVFNDRGEFIGAGEARRPPCSRGSSCRAWAAGASTRKAARRWRRSTRPGSPTWATRRRSRTRWSTWRSRRARRPASGLGARTAASRSGPGRGG